MFRSGGALRSRILSGFASLLLVSAPASAPWSTLAWAQVQGDTPPPGQSPLQTQPAASPAPSAGPAPAQPAPRQPSAIEATPLAPPGAAASPATPSPATPSPGAPPAAADGLVAPPLVDPKGVQTQKETAPPVPDGAAVPAPHELTLSPMPVITKQSTASWAEGYDKLTATMRELSTELARLGLARAGDFIVVYTASDDAGFEYEVQVPFSGATTGKPLGDMQLSGSYSGKVLKFTHTGAFSDMDNTYEQIANYLDSKSLESENLYIEQYRTDPLTTPPDQLTIDILIPLR